MSVAYNTGSDETTWTLPYTAAGTMQVVTRHNTVGMKEGIIIPVTQQTSNILASGNNVIGAVPLENGQYNFLVQSKNDQVSIALVNDTFLPSNYLSAEWEAHYTSRSQRI
jgi:hypothetical protein